MNAQTTHFFLLLAVELRPNTRAGRHSLSQSQTGHLAQHLADDLSRLHADISHLDLSFAAALFDAVEVLRPGWPLHTALASIEERAPRSHENAVRIIGMGSHDDKMPAALEPDPEFATGNFRLLPILLSGKPDQLQAVADALEQDLVETGMAGPGLALQIQELFALQVEHCRFLTLNDLVAMTAMNYEHMGLGTLWPIIEGALFAADTPVWLDQKPEPLVYFNGSEARIAMIDFEVWLAQGYAPAHLDRDRLPAHYELFMVRQRQIASLLGAHQIPLTFDHCPAGQDPKQAVSS